MSIAGEGEWKWSTNGVATFVKTETAEISFFWVIFADIYDSIMGDVPAL